MSQSDYNALAISQVSADAPLLRLLIKYRWSLGYRYDSSGWENQVTEMGFESYPVARSIVSCFGGLKFWSLVNVEFYNHRSEPFHFGGEMSHDVECMIEGLVDAQASIGLGLCPVGVITDENGDEENQVAVSACGDFFLVGEGNGLSLVVRPAGSSIRDLLRTLFALEAVPRGRLTVLPL